jgi:cytidine deaminase
LLGGDARFQEFPMVHRISMRASKCERYEQLARLAEAANTHAYPPFSDFKVGVAVLLWDGRVYIGVNTEDPSIGLTVHGEMSAVNAAIADGALDDARRAGLDEYTFIKAVAVMPNRMFDAYPCGHCCDFLSGYGAKFDIVVRRPDGSLAWARLSEVMPLMPDAKNAKALTLSAQCLNHLSNPADHVNDLPKATTTTARSEHRVPPSAKCCELHVRGTHPLWM